MIFSRSFKCLNLQQLESKIENKSINCGKKFFDYFSDQPIRASTFLNGKLIRKQHITHWLSICIFSISKFNPKPTSWFSLCCIGIITRMDHYYSTLIAFNIPVPCSEPGGVLFIFHKTQTWIGWFFFYDTFLMKLGIFY